MHYGENAQDRSFEPGDQILALSHISSKSLQARHKGPYTVDKKFSDVNFIVKTPGRRSKSSYVIST